MDKDQMKLVEEYLNSQLRAAALHYVGCPNDPKTRKALGEVLGEVVSNSAEMIGLNSSNMFIQVGDIPAYNEPWETTTTTDGSEWARTNLEGYGLYLYPEFSCDCPEDERAVWAGDPNTTFHEVKRERDKRAKKEVYG